MRQDRSRAARSSGYRFSVDLGFGQTAPFSALTELISEPFQPCYVRFTKICPIVCGAPRSRSGLRRSKQRERNRIRGWANCPEYSTRKSRILTIDDLQNAISHCELEGVTPDLVESMLLRSWIRTIVVNEHADERFFQILDKNWDEVQARVQVHMARYSGLRFQ
jgi:hypothetical protein